MAMTVRQCNTERIARCSMTRASREPLDAAIGQLLPPYCPDGRQGNNQQTYDASCTHIAGRFDGHRNVAVLYRTHRLMEEVRGFHIKH